MFQNNRIRKSARTGLVPRPTPFQIVTMSQAANATTDFQANFFLKKKFGLYRVVDLTNRRLKQKLLNLLYSTVKAPGLVRASTTIPKRVRVIYARKFTKLFFQSGRKILSKVFLRKKTVIGRHLAKKVYNLVKKDWIRLEFSVRLIDLLLWSNIFYTYTDAKAFVKTFGVLVDSHIIHNEVYSPQIGSFFTIFQHPRSLRYLRSKKKYVSVVLHKTKIYKYRVRTYLSRSKQKSFIVDWLCDYSILDFYKPSIVEFDLRTFSGAYVKKPHRTHTLTKTPTHTLSLSFYLTRLYTWKYIT